MSVKECHAIVSLFSITLMFFVCGGECGEWWCLLNVVAGIFGTCLLIRYGLFQGPVSE